MKFLGSKILVALAGLGAMASLMHLRLEFNDANAADKDAVWTEKSEPPKDLSKEALAMNSVFADLAERLSPAVVNIFTKSRVNMNRQMPQMDIFEFFFGQPGFPQQQMPRQREAQSLGSGFVISQDGIIVTNSHVVRIENRNADQVSVKFLGEPENATGHIAEILGVDPSTDVAVLRLKDKSKVKAITPFGDSSKLRVGEWVIAIGNPFGHTHSVTQGIVSALGRASTGLDIRANFIQTDASINPGNSGGPLINLNGEVIGINTAIDARGPGIGFAIPIDTAKGVIKQLIEKGEVSRGWIGIYGSELNPDIARSLKLKEPLGALIQDVTPGGPADKAGLQAYDVIRKIDGKDINSMRDLLIVIGAVAPGTKVSLDLIREGKQRKLDLTVEQYPDEEALAQSQGQRRRGQPAPGAGGGGSAAVNRAGLKLAPLSPESRRQLGLPPNAQGVLVTEVAPNSLAAQAGLSPGDLIKEIDQQPVKSVAQAEELIRKAKGAVLLRVQSGNVSVILSLELAS